MGKISKSSTSRENTRSRNYHPPAQPGAGSNIHIDEQGQRGQKQHKGLNQGYIGRRDNLGNGGSIDGGNPGGKQEKEAQEKIAVIFGRPPQNADGIDDKKQKSRDKRAQK